MIYTAVPLSLMGGVIVPIFLGMVGIAVLGILWAIFNGELFAGRICNTIFSILIISIIYAVGTSSWEEYNKHISLVNEPVEAQLVGQVESVEAGSTGKYSAGLFPVMHVQYQTPDGIVSFRKIDGQIYPSTAILYRNKR